MLSAMTYQFAPVNLTSVALHNLAAYRTSTKCGLGRSQVVGVMRAAGHHSFDEARLKVLENGPSRGEPTYPEARDLSRILLAPGILALMTSIQPACGTTDPTLVNPGRPFPSGTLTTFNVGVDKGDDMDLLTNGAILPLSVACRIAIRFGLNDPIELERAPWMLELWDAAATNARGAAPGECVWCFGTGGTHMPTCVPGHVLAPRYDQSHLLAHIPKPRRTNGKRASAPGRGLKAQRKLVGLTQDELGARVGMSGTYIARIEQETISLTEAKANQLSQGLGCRPEQLYVAPPEKG